MTLAAHHPDDATLLRRYVGEQAEEAFAELVRRHIGLVHSAALRQVGGNTASAVDVTQAVFTELARQADRLARHPALTGWLYTTTHHLAARHVRDEIRRQRREQEAHAMQELLQESVADHPLDWAQLRPVLDAAMHDLGEADRMAVLLRHFEQRPLAEIGARLGLSENAARMRVDRALEKLRVKLAKRGVISTAAALAVAMTGPEVTAAPATLAALVTTAALAATVTTTSTFGLLTLMASTKLKLSVAALIAVVATTSFVWQSRSQQRLERENVALHQQVARLTEDAHQSATRAAEERSRLRQPSPELLRLRGEAARLQREMADSRLSASPTAAQPVGTPESPAIEALIDADRNHYARRLGELRLLLEAVRRFAHEHDGRVPDSLEDALRLVTLDPDPVSAEALRTLQTGDFELMFSGSLEDIANPATAAVIRERTAHRELGGKVEIAKNWIRYYVLANGTFASSENIDGDDRAWEAEHQVQLAQQKPSASQ